MMTPEQARALDDLRGRGYLMKDEAERLAKDARLVGALYPDAVKQVAAIVRACRLLHDEANAVLLRESAAAKVGGNGAGAWTKGENES